MHSLTRLPCVALFLCLTLSGLPIFAAEPPQVLDSRWRIQQIASEPGLVTPTGCCFDDQGRLLVIECHTHFPPDDYEGPKTDRIYRFTDSDGDGILDEKRLFHSGTSPTMNIVSLGGNAFAVATRSQVIRLEDNDDDGVADVETVLLDHQTKATYPHNGLSGLALSDDGWLYVGQGENFGEPYALVGTDGSRQVGGGEGGNVFRCRVDGSNVERFATGFWNPFGMVFDRHGRLWAAGNDPDAMPPNRLMHVTEAADFGFQFRFGRAGIHPLQSWNGELPGTMPMAAATGEAICSIVIHGKYIYAASWGDNRIERYELFPDGAGFSSKTEVVVQGDSMFRPVGLAIAPDGSIYVTDWVDRSYPVHGKGRVWRLSQKDETVDATDQTPSPNESEHLADQLRAEMSTNAAERIAMLQHPDVFIRQAAIARLANSARFDIRAMNREPADVVVGMLISARWQELCGKANFNPQQRDAMLRWAIAHSDDRVCLTAVRWATERKCHELLPDIRAVLSRESLSPRLFSAAIASIAYIETGSASGRKRDPAIEKLLLEFASDPKQSAELRGLAVAKLPVESNIPSDRDLLKWIVGENAREFSRSAVSMIRSRAAQGHQKILRQIVENEDLDLQTRSDALAGLAGEFQPGDSWIVELMNNASGPLAVEANRVLQADSTDQRTSDPPADDLAAWSDRVLDGGDVDAGRRVFFRTQCASCHRHGGRGSLTGPDLTTLAGTTTQERILESILLPSKEIGPMYVPWKVLTVDGDVIVGLKLDKAGVGNRRQFQTADGKIVGVALEDIERQEPVKTSIMPKGLEKTMSLEELKDLLAFLASP